MALAPVVALEIGTAKVGVLVGEVREDSGITITGIGQCPSCGVRKSMLVDLEAATACIRAALEGAEQTAGVEIHEVYLTLSGGHIQSEINQGSTPVYDPRRGVTREDIEEVLSSARIINLSHDREILHTVPQKYTVDNHAGIINPEGMQGAKLALDMLIVHGQRNSMNNAVNAAANAGVEVRDAAFSGLCSALAALTPEQKECGVVLVDVGAGTSGYVVYAGGTIATAGVLAVGGDHITNDIAQGFNISLKRAETLKQESGTLIVDSSAHFQRLTIPAEVGFAACSIAAADLHAIIHARVDELFEWLKREIEKRCPVAQLGAGVVLTGGTAHLKGIEAVAARVFDLPCAVGRPKNFSGMASAQEGPAYASLLGMLRYAVRSGSRGAKSISFTDLIKRWFKGES